MNYLIYVCNALDDLTKLERKIKTDSPACTRKVFLNAQNLKSKTVNPIVLSLGRGKSNYSFKFYTSKVKRVNGITVIYAPFFSFKILSELISFLWPLTLMLRFKKIKGKKVFLFWNRTIAFIPVLILSKILRFRNVLDLEDGNLPLKLFTINYFKVKIKTIIYDLFCSHALVTCNALKKKLKFKNVLCHYGFFEEAVQNIKFNNTDKINFHLGGTVSNSTGSDLVILAIKKLRKNNYKFAKKISFIITGKGDSIAEFKSLSNSNDPPIVNVYCNQSFYEYSKTLRNCHVGLALKPKSGNLSETTFPSKVIEIANNGLLLVSTDISDVKLLFSDGALYTNSNIDDFVKLLEWITINSNEVKKIANKGSKKITYFCNRSETKSRLNNFLFK